MSKHVNAMAFEVFPAKRHGSYPFQVSLSINEDVLADFCRLG